MRAKSLSYTPRPCSTARMSTALPFAPVPLRARRDGWTPARQHAFVAALRETRCVTAAAGAVGMSWQSAYRLRARADAASFAAAWDAAVARPELPDDFTGRAMGGIATPIMYRGRQVGERRRFDNRLALYILRLRCPDRYGTAPDHAGAAPTDRGAAYAEAIARLEADLATGSAPGDERDSRGGVASTSSPSAGAPLRPRRPSGPRSIARRRLDTG